MAKYSFDNICDHTVQRDIVALPCMSTGGRERQERSVERDRAVGGANDMDVERAPYHCGLW